MKNPNYSLHHPANKPSPRQLDILRRVALGQTDKEIAHGLKISEETVGTHLRTIFDKLGVPNRAAAVAVCAERRYTWGYEEVGGRVYLAEAIGVTMVKIGFTQNGVKRRISEIQKTCPVKLKLLAEIPGGRITEREIHKRFAHLRQSGEWFRLTKEIADFISKLPTVNTV